MARKTVTRKAVRSPYLITTWMPLDAAPLDTPILVTDGTHVFKGEFIMCSTGLTFFVNLHGFGATYELIIPMLTGWNPVNVLY